LFPPGIFKPSAGPDMGAEPGGILPAASAAAAGRQIPLVHEGNAPGIRKRQTSLLPWSKWKGIACRPGVSSGLRSRPTTPPPPARIKR